MKKSKTILLIISALVIVIAITLIILSRDFIKQNQDKQGYALDKQELSSTILKKLNEYLPKTNVDSLVINNNDSVLYKYGNTKKSTNLASVRKSIISLLYGIAEKKGLVKLDSTLKELGIDEENYTLSEVEKSATIRDLLMARSGVYIESGAEAKKMKENRPKRHQYKPGEFYYYNNWDFNVLGFIFEQETKISIGKALDDWIGKKIGLQDFHPDHVIYSKESDSKFDTWRIYMSNRDLARIGSLILNNGKWNGEEIIPEEWIIESTQSYSETPYEEFRYGYLWWIHKPADVIMAMGSGGQFLIVDENNNLSIAIKKDTGISILGMLMYRFFDNEVKTSTAIEIHKLLLEK